MNDSGKTKEEFLRVKQLFEDTLLPPDCKIISIERIQNIELWEGFKWSVLILQFVLDMCG